LVAALPKLILLKIHTNGLNPDRILARVIPTLYAKVPFHLMIISLDSLGDEHNRIRGYPGAFKRVIETADRLIALERDHPHFHVAFETTISPHNRDQIIAVSNYIANHFPGHVHINTLAEDGAMVGKGANSSNFASRSELPAIRKLAAKLPFNRPQNLVPLAYLGLMERFFNEGRSPIECLSGRDMIGIDAEGAVRACDYRPEPLGHLSETNGDLAALLKSPEVRRKVNELATCRACFSPCSAFPSMLRTPQVIMYGLLKSLSYRLQHKG
jgi:MoaA/NifB/PqqE/SkfB family radical SAM enzyme